MLSECQQRWNSVLNGISNYKTLLDQLEHWRQGREEVCIVTFNYDTLIEDALRSIGIPINEITDYISGREYKLIKLHGSVNWGKRIENPTMALLGADPWLIVKTLIDSKSAWTVTDEYRVITSRPIAALAGREVFSPALAIPVQTKKSYECPATHLVALESVLPQVSKVLLIGWRGAEDHFAKLLREKLPQDCLFHVVAGTTKAATEVTKRLENSGIAGRFGYSTGGFTGFILNREADTFLRLP